MSAQSVHGVGTHFGGGSAGCERSGRPGDVPLQKGPEGCDGKGRKRKALTHRLNKRGESHERFFTLEKQASGRTGRRSDLSLHSGYPAVHRERRPHGPEAGGLRQLQPGDHGPGPRPPDKKGYRAEGFTPVDMFPNSEHIEVVGSLSWAGMVLYNKS